MTQASRDGAAFGGSVAGEERFARIRERLDADGRVTVRELADELGASQMTVRRDLQQLEAIGVLRRVHGGAVQVGPTVFAERDRQQAQAKAAIARKLLELVPDEGAIGLDASSTLVRLAGLLPGARDLTVITNSLQTFSALQDKHGIEPQLTGGRLEPRTGSLVGDLAVRSAGQLLMQRLFVSAAAVDPAVGTSEACLAEAEVKRALAAHAHEIVLAADSTKLGHWSVATALRWDRIDLLVTELDPGDPLLDPYRELTRLV